MPSSEPDRLAKAYIELVELFKRGAADEARALHQRIVGDLVAAVMGVWSDALHQMGEGDHYGALLSFQKVFNVHRQNLLNVELPISKTTCFAQIAGLLQTMGQPVAAAAATALATSGGDSFYQPTASCQIPILGALFERLFGRRTDGVFVEVGAYDGETYSNTSCLADLGWRGVYIEPVERAYQKCVERHRRNPLVSVLNRAIGPEESVIRFSDNGEFSTGSADGMAVGAANNWIDAAGGLEVEVRQVRLDAVLARAAIEPGFDLLVVDVEGMEEQVFDSFALEQWRPRCMIVELLDLSTATAGHERSIGASARVRAAIHRCGYEEVYRDQANTVFRQSDAGRAPSS